MRLSQKNSVWTVLAFLCLAIATADAQNNFKYRAYLKKVDSAGFYRISLQPGFIAKSNPRLSDIRLMDLRGNIVPYVTGTNLPQVERQKFLVFPPVSVKSPADTGTTFIIKNKGKYPLSGLWIKLNNTDVDRSVNISGSDDLKKWFAIEEGVPLQKANSSSDGTYFQFLSFPPTRYRYLKVLVNDKNKAPIEFLTAGIYTQQSTDVTYSPVPYQQIIKKDSNNVSYITIRLNDIYLVNQVKLKVSEPKYYKRDVSIYEIDKKEPSVIYTGELNSNRPGEIFLDAKANKLQLQITNGDNLPLKIADIKLLQADRYIVAYLEAGKPYELFTGDAKAEAPNYDLKFFTDSIHGKIPKISHDEVMKNVTYSISVKENKTDYSLFIWLAIAVVLLVLSFLTYRMIMEVNTRPPSK